MSSARLWVSIGCVSAILAASVACEKRTGDEQVTHAVPPAAGKGDRISEIRDPDSPKRAASSSEVNVTGAVVIAIDNFDETGDGKSSGTIYVSDLGSTQAYAGVALYQPSFVPANLRIGAGDTFDLIGTYQENTDVPVKFDPGTFLPQVASPSAVFRFDSKLPDPAKVDVKDLAQFDTGKQWLNMLVRVTNVKVLHDARGRNTKSGRFALRLLPEPAKSDAGAPATAAQFCDPFPTAPQLVNELFDTRLDGLEDKLNGSEDITLKSLTGVVTFFCNLHIAPRSAADIEF